MTLDILILLFNAATLAFNVAIYRRLRNQRITVSAEIIEDPPAEVAS